MRSARWWLDWWALPLAFSLKACAAPVPTPGAAPTPMPDDPVASPPFEVSAVIRQVGTVTREGLLALARGAAIDELRNDPAVLDPAVLDPAVLDPVISPERGVDEPLLAWSDGAVSTDLLGARVTRRGQVLDPDGNVRDRDGVVIAVRARQFTLPWSEPHHPGPARPRTRVAPPRRPGGTMTMNTRRERSRAVALTALFTVLGAGGCAPEPVEFSDDASPDRGSPTDRLAVSGVSAGTDVAAAPDRAIAPAGCRRDEDCAKDPGGLLCDLAIHRCVRCRTDGDCPDGSSPGRDTGPLASTDREGDFDVETETNLDAGSRLDAGPGMAVDVPRASDLGDVPVLGPRRYDPGPDLYVGRACPAGQARCPTTAFRDEPAAWNRCTALIAGACPAPDIIVRREWIADDTDEPTPNVLRLSLTRFAPTDPEVTEGCVRGFGWRRLLRFNFTALNIGTGPLNVGRPDENDPVHWEFFTAHGHFHARGWGDYALRTLAGVDAVRGRKQSFCLEDNIREEGGDPALRRYPPPLCERFSPELSYAERPEFGLSPLWGDEYPSSVPCQWLDVGPETARDGADYVPDGIYTLAVGVNVGDRTPVPLYRESNYANNTASIRVELRGLTAVACTDNAGDACPGGAARRTCDGRCP